MASIKAEVKPCCKHVMDLLINQRKRLCRTETITAIKLSD